MKLQAVHMQALCDWFMFGVDVMHPRYGLIVAVTTTTQRAKPSWTACLVYVTVVSTLVTAAALYWRSCSGSSSSTSTAAAVAPLEDAAVKCHACAQQQ
eukprot:8158-Heterococcus_DN1.PRE.4